MPRASEEITATGRKAASAGTTDNVEFGSNARGARPLDASSRPLDPVDALRRRSDIPTQLALAATLLTGALSLALPSPAGAAIGRIDGNPLDVYVDGIGGLQAIYDGETVGAFAAAPWEPLNPQLGRAGLEVSVFGDNVNALGATGMRIPVSGPTLTNGPQPGEQVLTSVYRLLDAQESRPPATEFPILQVREEVSYVNDPSPASGQQRVVVRYTFSAPSDAVYSQLTITPAVLGALILDRGPQGVGFFSAGTGGQSVGAGNGNVRSALVSSASSLWDRYQQGAPATVFESFAQTSGFDGTVAETLVDAAIGVSWDSLPPVAMGQPPVEVEVSWLLGRPTPIPPPPPPPAPPAPTPPAPFPAPPVIVPVADRSVLALPLGGRVLARLPGTGRYVDVTTLERLPLGTLVDTTDGRVRLTTAADRGSATQSAVFYGGTFRIGQRSVGGGRGKLVTVLTLSGPRPVCRQAKTKRSTRTRRAAPRPRARARKARKAGKPRRLWGNGRGRFSIRGQYSSATVRGTRWLVTDICGGTLTRVTQGVVRVEDFARGKTVTVKAGRSYLARPRR